MLVIDKERLRPKLAGADVHEKLRSWARTLGTAAYLLPSAENVSAFWDMELPPDSRLIVDSTTAESARSSIVRESIDKIMVGGVMTDGYTVEKFYSHKPTATLAMFLALNAYSIVKAELDNDASSYPIDFLAVDDSPNGKTMRMFEMHGGRCVMAIDEWAALTMQESLVSRQVADFWRCAMEVHDRIMVGRNATIERRLKRIATKARSGLENEYLGRRTDDDHITVAQIIGMLENKSVIGRTSADRIMKLIGV